MKASPRSSNLLVGILALLLIALVVGVIVILATQYNLLNQSTPAAATPRSVLVTRVVPGTDLTARAFPTLPPAWTETPSPTISPTAPTVTPSATETSTITPTFAPSNTRAPTVTGPTPTRRPTLTPSRTPTKTATPTVTASARASATTGQD